MKRKNCGVEGFVETHPRSTDYMNEQFQVCIGFLGRQYRRDYTYGIVSGVDVVLHLQLFVFAVWYLYITHTCPAHRPFILPGTNSLRVHAHVLSLKIWWGTPTSLCNNSNSRTHQFTRMAYPWKNVCGTNQFKHQQQPTHPPIHAHRHVPPFIPCKTCKLMRT